MKLCYFAKIFTFFSPPALAQGMYKCYGMFLALSLANGGKACHCLCRSVYRFIVDGDAIPTVNDIPYQRTRDILSKVYCKMSISKYF